MSSSRPSDDRERGRIEERGGSLRVVVYAGQDPVTGKRVYLREKVDGTGKASYKKAKSVLGKLVSQVDEQRSVNSSVTLGYAIDEFMRVTELEDSTRKTYEGYIKRTIQPALGSEAAKNISAHALESLYTDLRRCRTRCDRTPFIEHKTDKEHDCVKAKCKPHECNPMAASTVRQIHAIISGALGAANRWGWITTNQAQIAKRPKQKPPEPDPPTAAEAARLADAAFELDEDWGVLVWLAMTTGMRRSELCGLRFSRIDLDAEVIDLRRNWVLGKEKDTKTHQNRRSALDSEP